MTTATRDFQKAKVYAAEQTLRWLYDHPASCNTIAGVTVQLEPEARFASLDSISTYLDRVVSHPAVIAEFGHRGRIGIRERKGQRLAHYEPATATIAISTAGTRWGLRELIVLHEVAHHFAHDVGDGAHGPRFAAVMVHLIELIMGPQAALALRLLFVERDVRH